jgi:hypothetical protein
MPPEKSGGIFLAQFSKTALQSQKALKKRRKFVIISIIDYILDKSVF